MISIKEINKKDFGLCFELDSNTISLWNKNQWNEELKKEGTKVFGILNFEKLIGICVFQIVLDESQINYFAIKKKFQRMGFGTCLMKHTIEKCQQLKIKKLLLEVSEKNLAAEEFYSYFGFSTVGIRKNYYKDGSDAFLKEKKLFKYN